MTRKYVISIATSLLLLLALLAFISCKGSLSSLSQSEQEARFSSLLQDQIFPLLDAGVSPDFQYQSKHYFIHVLVRRPSNEYHSKTLKKLIAYGAKLDVLDPNKNTALHVAIDSLNTQAAIILLENGAAGSINQPNAYGLTPLHLAMLRGEESVAYHIISMGADLEIRDPLGQAPLHLAVYYGPLQLVYLMLDRGADPNVLDSAGRTPLMVAARERPISPLYLELLKTLMQRGADLNLKDKDGKTATDHASDTGNSVALKEFEAFR